MDYEDEDENENEDTGINIVRVIRFKSMSYNAAKMLSTFASVKNFKLKPQTYTIDTIFAKCHYRFTTLFFVISSILVTSNQYIGNAIHCIVSGVPQHVVETYCFIQSTYTVARYHNITMLENGEISHLGVGTHSVHSEEPIIRHAYYQWVPFVLFGQALMFYAPRFIWKRLEGNAIQALVGGLQNARFSLLDKDVSIGKANVPSKQNKEKCLNKLQEIFTAHTVINSSWACKMIFCESLYIVNLVLQYFLTDWFLGGQFFMLGAKIFSAGYIPLGLLESVFPKVTKCNFYKYGPSGSLQFHDAMCVLAMNIVNEKVYAFLWFWYLVLGIITLIGVLMFLLSLLLHARSIRFNQYLFKLKHNNDDPWQYLSVTKQPNYSDWLFIYYCCQNLDGLTFQDLLVRIAKKLDLETEDVDDEKKLIDIA